MKTLSILYDTHIDFEAAADSTYFAGRRNNIHTYSIVCQTTFLLVDHFKRDAYLYHNNPQCNALLGNPNQQEPVLEDFFDRFVSDEDSELFVVCATAIKDAMRNDFLNGNRSYYFLLDLMLAAPKRKPKRYKLTVFPYLYTPDDRLWVTGYLIAPSESEVSGNLKLFELNESHYNFDMEDMVFRKEEFTRKLTEKEKRILKMSAEGFTEQQIADQMNINITALKNRKLALFEKMEVNTIYAAISRAFKNGDI